MDNSLSDPDKCIGDERSLMRAVQELAAVKTSLTYIMVSLQSANEKITSISEALTSGLLSSEEKKQKQQHQQKRR